jgi:hypothetical protein
MKNKLVDEFENIPCTFLSVSNIGNIPNLETQECLNSRMINKFRNLNENLNISPDSSGPSWIWFPSII